MAAQAPSGATLGTGVGVLDAVVVGAGFSGLYLLYRLRQQGLRAVAIERADDVGGTWYWNRYPGARCDIESIDYQYSFSPELLQEWTWTERYAAQPEILAYLQHVADRFDLRRDIAFETTVTQARFDDARDCWLVRCTGPAGEQRLEARSLILAVGNLSQPKTPDIPGVELFAGESVFTSRWPKGGVDVAGKRVGVIGTGSTAIQAVPQLAAQAERLVVFQRTAAYSVPARNRPLPPTELAAAIAEYPNRRAVCEQSESGVPFPPTDRRGRDVDAAQREALYEAGWQRGGINALSYAFADFVTDETVNVTGQDFLRAKIRSIVQDPQTADDLSPRHWIGTKRTCVDTGYYETYNRPNVTLVNLRREPIVSIDATGIQTSDRHIDLDVLVYALGFDAMTGGFTAVDIVGSNGQTLKDAWADGPRTYLGLATHGFPNLFLITGPGSPGVLSNMVVSIEQHVDWVCACLAHLRDSGATRIEADLDAQDAWVEGLAVSAADTLYIRADSWYMGANVPGKPRVFMPYVNGCGVYRQTCDAVAAEGYRGFHITSNTADPSTVSAH